MFSDAKIYSPKINTPFGPSHKNYPIFRKVSYAIDGLRQYTIFNMLPTLPQWVDISSRVITYNGMNYDGIKWTPGTADIVINHWLNHLNHSDSLASYPIRCGCKNSGDITTQL